jgi:hypothetical protein
MRKVVIVYGLISGVIAGGLMWLLVSFVGDGTIDFDSGVTWGYATMIVALSLVFFGIKSFRDNNGGRITFGKALQVGILISLISAVCYAASWEVYHRTGRGREFIHKYMAYQLDKMRQEGASEAEIEKTRAESERFVELYNNFFIRFGMTLLEILPVGVIVTLVSAALLRKRDVLPAEPA